LYEIFIFLKKVGSTMMYGNMPMMIFILAAGYLFTVYLLLALAKRSGQKSATRTFVPINNEKHQQAVSVKPPVAEMVNNQESIVT
jgi:hypothetical protein